nr:TPA_asm: m36.5 sORF [Murid betaherpesvirus 1]DBA07768.1 TPA_asm: m36.5 sORF [Murid betaherpesvirus 1]
MAPKGSMMRMSRGRKTEVAALYPTTAKMSKVLENLRTTEHMTEVRLMTVPRLQEVTVP